MSVFVTTYANAQTAFEQPKFLDNTYVGINAGVNTPLSFDNTFPLNTVLNIRVGKDLTPIVGFYVEGGLWFNGNTDNGIDFSENEVSNVSVSLGNTINFSNLCFGYKPRFFEVMSSVSLGWAHLFNAVDQNEFIAKTGVDFAFNLGNEKQYQIYIEPAVNWNLTGNYSGIQFDKNHAYLQLLVGFNYKFKCSNGTHGFKTYDITALNNEINELRAQLAEKPTEITKVVTTEKLIEVPIGTTVVYFAEGKSELTTETTATLDNIVDANAEYIIEGYASETGTDEINEKLSEDRANNVAAYLKDKNCNIKLINHYSNTSTPVARVVIIKTSK